MANSEVDPIVQKVQAQLETPDRNAAAQAYTLLLSELRQYQNNGTGCVQELTSQLEKSGVLPQIALGWLQTDYDKINSNKDFGISKDEVNDYAGKGGFADAELNAILANQLLNTDSGSPQFDTVAKYKKASDHDLIEKSDLRKHDRQETREKRRENEHATTRDAADPLFEGTPPLMAILDSSSNGKCDGRVSAQDMRRFLTDYEQNNKTADAGNAPYTEENATYVQDLLDGKYPDITGPNFTGFSARALARRAGLDYVEINSIDDYEGLVSAYQDKGGRVGLPPQPEAIEEQVEPETSTEAMQIKDKPELLSQIKELATYQDGFGPSQVALTLLKAGMEPGAKVAHADLMKLTNDIMTLSGMTADANWRVHPVPHPGDVAPVVANLEELMCNNPKLRESLENLAKKNQDVEHTNEED